MTFYADMVYLYRTTLLHHQRNNEKARKAAPRQNTGRNLQEAKGEMRIPGHLYTELRSESGGRKLGGVFSRGAAHLEKRIQETEREALAMVSQAKTKEEIIDLVFKDPGVKHGLKIFSPSEFGKLNISEQDSKFFIKCPVSDRKKVAKPEEIIRQLTINKLTADLRYPLKRLDVEVPVKMGSAYASKKADIVVYAEDGKENPYIIIEVKKPLRKDGLEQLHSYMNATVFTMAAG